MYIDNDIYWSSSSALYDIQPDYGEVNNFAPKFVADVWDHKQNCHENFSIKTTGNDCPNETHFFSEYRVSDRIFWNEGIVAKLQPCWEFCISQSSHILAGFHYNKIF